MQSSRHTVLIDADSDGIILNGAPAVKSRVRVVLTLDLDRGCRRWAHSSRRRARSLSRRGSALTAFAGRILEIRAVPFMDDPVHHMEFLLDCGVPVTAFSIASARSRTIRAGGSLSGVGYLFGNLDEGGLTLRRGVDAVVCGVRRPGPSETMPDDGWLAVDLSFQTVSTADP